MPDREQPIEEHILIDEVQSPMPTRRNTGWPRESRRHSEAAIEGHRRRGTPNPPAETGAVEADDALTLRIYPPLPSLVIDLNSYRNPRVVLEGLPRVRGWRANSGHAVIANEGDTVGIAIDQSNPWWHHEYVNFGKGQPYRLGRVLPYSRWTELAGVDNPPAIVFRMQVISTKLLAETFKAIWSLYRRRFTPAAFAQTILLLDGRQRSATFIMEVPNNSLTAGFVIGGIAPRVRSTDPNDRLVVSGTIYYDIERRRWVRAW